MLKNISNLGVILSKSELKSTHGGRSIACDFGNGESWLATTDVPGQIGSLYIVCKGQGGKPRLLCPIQ